MFSISKRRRTAAALAAAGAAALSLCLTLPADASPVPPVASASLNGTWVNTNPATRGIVQIVVQPTRNRAVSVDAFGACQPTLCEWGRVPAIVYGSSTSASTGTTFQSNQGFFSNGKEWSRTQLLGSLSLAPSGAPVLTVRELTVFEDGSGRKDYTQVETFTPGKGQAATMNGNAVSGYLRGAPPLANAGLFGTWKPAGPSNNLAEVVISGTPAAPVVRAYGACTPTPCSWGAARGVTYGATISTLRGTTELAPYVFSFKNTQLVMKYSIGADDTETLTVTAYNEFTDGRSNYATTQTLVRAS